MVSGSSSKKVGLKPPLRSSIVALAAWECAPTTDWQTEPNLPLLAWEKGLPFFAPPAPPPSALQSIRHTFPLQLLRSELGAHFPTPQRNISFFPRLRSSSSHDCLTERGWVAGLRKTDSNVMRDDRVSIIKILPASCRFVLDQYSLNLVHWITFKHNLSFTTSKPWLFIVWIFVKIFAHCASIDLPKIGFFLKKNQGLNHFSFFAALGFFKIYIFFSVSIGKTDSRFEQQFNKKYRSIPIFCHWISFRFERDSVNEIHKRLNENKPAEWHVVSVAHAKLHMLWSDTSSNSLRIGCFALIMSAFKYVQK